MRLRTAMALPTVLLRPRHPPPFKGDVFRTGVLLAGLVAPSADSFAGSWPQQPVRILTGPLAAGSSIDATARVLAEELSKRWKQSVVVDTRPGADGIIAAKA